MQGPVEITFKDIEKTPDLEDFINRRISKLEKICSYMISCRVTIERPQKYPDTGNPHRVRIDIKVPPAHEIIAKQSGSQGDMHDPLSVIIGKTFQAAERQLRELTKKQHGLIKAHPQQQVMGIVDKLFIEQGYGFIRTIDTSDEVYFHKNSVLHNDFSRIKIGTGVRFVSEIGQKGLQASSVEIIDKHKTA